MTDEEQDECLNFVERFQKIKNKNRKKLNYDRYDTGDMMLDRLNWLEDNKRGRNKCK